MRKARARRLATACFVVFAALLAGCAFPTRISSVAPEVPRDVTPVIVHGSLAAFDDVENKRRLEHIMASPEMKAIEREMIAGVFDASLASLDDSTRQKRLEEIGDRYAHGVLSVISREVSSELAPVARTLAASAVRGALDEAMAPLGGKSTGPVPTGQLRAVFHDQMAPAFADVLHDAEVQRAAGEVARAMGHEAVVGGSQALHDIEARSARDGPLRRAVALAGRGARVMTTLTWVLVAVIALLGVWLAKMMFQARRATARTAHAEVSLARDVGVALDDEKRAMVGAPTGRHLVSARGRVGRGGGPIRRGPSPRRRSRDTSG